MIKIGQATTLATILSIQSSYIVPHFIYYAPNEQARDFKMLRSAHNEIRYFRM